MRIARGACVFVPVVGRRSWSETDRPPHSQRDIRGRRRRQVFGVDRDITPSQLQQACCCETNGSTSDDSVASLPGCHRLLDSEIRCAPRQRHSPAGMSVIVNHGLRTKTCRVDEKSIFPSRPKANHSPDDAVPRHVDSGEGPPRQERGWSSAGYGHGGDESAGGGQARRLQKSSPVDTRWVHSDSPAATTFSWSHEVGCARTSPIGP